MTKQEQIRTRAQISVVLMEIDKIQLDLFSFEYQEKIEKIYNELQNLRAIVNSAKTQGQ
jgi:hypothetical protein